MTFRLAPMDPVNRGLTIVLLALPFVFLCAAVFGNRLLLAPALLLFAIYLWIWLWFRPTRFVVKPHALEIVWPVRRREIPREEVTTVRLLNKRDLRSETGRRMRVGAGGLWGAFGWLSTQRRGFVRMYVSRIDDFVWIERRGKQPWLITPERPEEFARSLRKT